MNNYLILSFKNGYLVFSSYESVPFSKKDINSNKIINNKYVYTFKYFNKNKLDIMSLINRVLLKNKIYNIYSEDEFLTTLILDFIKILNIKGLYLKGKKALTLDECTKIINNRNLNYINIYYAPINYVDKIKKSGKKVDISYKKDISDEFMIGMDTIDIDALYYKRVLHFKKDYYSEKDFLKFLSINTSLKTIHIHNYSLTTLKSIIKCLKNNNIWDVNLLIYQYEDNFKKDFNEIKLLNKEYEKNIKIIYSEKFISNNIFKQFTYNGINFVFSLIVYVLFIGVIFNEIGNYTSLLDLEKINYEMYLSKLDEEIERQESVSYDEEDEEVTKEVKDKYDLEESFEYLLSQNKDTVGFIKVKNTKVNYPVVKTSDNDYYLKHDFFKKTTSVGWIFMDFRNNAIDLDDNTIIYGHKLKSGLMFGTLSNALKSSWYKNTENQIIEFNTINKKMKWRIFSIYRTDYTTDYLVTNFITNTKFDEWVNMIKGRSIYNFKQNLTYGDKILTLSTCIGPSSANQRLVIHAVLIEEG